MPRVWTPTISVAVLLAALGLFLGSVSLKAQPQVKKTWKFKAQQGVMTINLLDSSATAGTYALEIFYGHESHPSLAEEVEFLTEVLQQLAPLGISPDNLTSIFMRGFAKPEVAKQIAIAALHSKEWESYPQVIGGAERVVRDLLDSSGAYSRLNDAFRKYNLKVSLAGVEKVSGIKCLDLKLNDPICNVRHNPRVPDGANLYFILGKDRQGVYRFDRRSRWQLIRLI